MSRAKQPTEADWSAGIGTWDKLAELALDQRNQRKCILFSVACCRRHPLASTSGPAIGSVIDLAERYANGEIPASALHSHLPLFVDEQLTPAGDGVTGTQPFHPFRMLFPDVMPPGAAYVPTLLRDRMPIGARRAEQDAQVFILRDIFGNPFRPVSLDPQWLTSTVVALSRGIYEERAFDRMPILADALQDAGCENAEILDHCRGPGPHVRGCWVVDLILGKQ